MKSFLIWLSASLLVLVVGEPPSSYTNSEPWGHIGDVKENYGGKGHSSYDSYNAPKSSYGPPKSEYGVPSKGGYNSPKSSYGPPSSSYGPPPKKAATPTIHHTTVIVVKKPRKKAIKGRYIWVPTLPRLKVIRPKVHFRAPRVKVIPPQFKFSPPRFEWW